MILFVLLSACLPVDTAETCTTDIVPSVIVTPTLDGAPYPAVVTAVDAAGDAVGVECLTEADGGCIQWAVGEDDDGVLTLTVAATDDCATTTETADVDVSIDALGCHVETETVDVPLTHWSGC